MPKSKAKAVASAEALTIVFDRGVERGAVGVGDGVITCRVGFQQTSVRAHDERYSVV